MESLTTGEEMVTRWWVDWVLLSKGKNKKVFGPFQVCHNIPRRVGPEWTGFRFCSNTLNNANEWVEEPVARTPPPLEPIVPNSGNRLMTSSFTGLMVFRKAGDISSPVEADVPG